MHYLGHAAPIHGLARVASSIEVVIYDELPHEMIKA